MLRITITFMLRIIVALVVCDVRWIAMVSSSNIRNCWLLCYWFQRLYLQLRLAVSSLNDVVCKFGFNIGFTRCSGQVKVVRRLFSSLHLSVKVSLSLGLMALLVFTRGCWEDRLCQLALLISSFSWMVVMFQVWLLHDGLYVAIGIVSGNDFFNCIRLLRLLRLYLVLVFKAALLRLADKALLHLINIRRGHCTSLVSLRWSTMFAAQVIMMAGKIAIFWPVEFRAETVLLALMVVNGVLGSKSAHGMLSLRHVLLHGLRLNINVINLLLSTCGWLCLMLLSGLLMATVFIIRLRHNRAHFIFLGEIESYSRAIGWSCAPSRIMICEFQIISSILKHLLLTRLVKLLIILFYALILLCLSNFSFLIHSFHLC